MFIKSIKHTSRFQGFLQLPGNVHKRLYHFRPGFFHLQKNLSLVGRNPNGMLTRQVNTYSAQPQKIWLKPDLLRDSNSAREVVDGNDLVPSMENKMCWVIPEKIDVQRFRTALQKSLTIFPTFAGRMQKSGTGYQISYSGQGLPIQFAQIDVVAHTAAKGREGIVSQDSYTMGQFVDANPFTILAPEDNTPMATVKLTYLTKTGQTIIGLSSSQAIGDAATVKYFMDAVSRFYQGLEPLNKPMYSMHKWTSGGPEDETASISRLATSSITSGDLNQLLWGGDNEGCSLLQISFTPDEVKALKRHIYQETNNNTPRISGQDAIVAYVVNLYNKFVDEPITTIRHILTYRLKETNESNKYRDMYNIGNGIYMVDVPVGELSELADKACALRNAITHSRKLSNLEALISARSSLAFDMMRNERVMPWSAQGITLVNGLQCFDFVEDASFGYPGRVQAYYSTCYAGFFNLTKPNPILLADGTWKRNDNNIDIAIPVPENVKERMFQQKAQDMKGLL
ncbi:hypothetical protein BDP27DRAFT_1452174 [Rhodocollybia butyracea]|uniref:Uncharacterized protein n=1 Tax=Rhodocollybia butyracea TaxID=206335 RepID=A0A9P5PDZ9_9AGAR|nr:hypothetical protein BDP27DRAFT_1452174 [Rhodocollybia butyracea]